MTTYYHAAPIYPPPAQPIQPPWLICSDCGALVSSEGTYQTLHTAFHAWVSSVQTAIVSIESHLETLNINHATDGVRQIMEDIEARLSDSNPNQT